MNKSDLVAKMAEGAGITQAQAEKALATFTCAVSCALREGDKVTLVGFGTFKAIDKKAKVGRNPKTGARINIPKKRVPKFIAGKELKALVK